MKPEKAGGEAKLLIVEDEVLIRMLAVDIASDMGYDVSEAGGGDEALAMLGAGHKVDLLFTDIDMPGRLDGIALASAVKREWPQIRIVLTSGKVRPKAVDIPGGGLFVPKPYTPSDLEAAFTAALE